MREVALGLVMLPVRFLCKRYSRFPSVWATTTGHLLYRNPCHRCPCGLAAEVRTIAFAESGKVNLAILHHPGTRSLMHKLKQSMSLSVRSHHSCFKNQMRNQSSAQDDGFHIRGAVDGIPVTFLIDTGASTSAIGTSLARVIGLDIGPSATKVKI